MMESKERVVIVGGRSSGMTERVLQAIEDELKVEKIERIKKLSKAERSRQEFREYIRKNFGE